MSMVAIDMSAGDEEMGDGQEVTPENDAVALVKEIQRVVTQVKKLEHEGLTTETHKELVELIDTIHALIQAGVFHNSYDTQVLLNSLLKTSRTSRI